MEKEAREDERWRKKLETRKGGERSQRRGKVEKEIRDEERWRKKPEKRKGQKETRDGHQG